MAAVDESVPLPERNVDKEFLMPIEDIFSISGRGTVVTGRIERGVIEGGTKWRSSQDPRRRTVVTVIEMFLKLLDEGQAGDNVGVLLRGTKDEVGAVGFWRSRGRSRRTRSSRVRCVLTKEEGGYRHTPFFDGYRPQFYFRTTDVTGSATALPSGGNGDDAGRQRGAGGDSDRPDRDGEGSAFAIREGGRTVGASTVTEILE
ncbi:MAG: EF-Tu/IF-2/RF-3 family GTPase [Thermoanaerobaculia bacterium]